MILYMTTITDFLVQTICEFLNYARERLAPHGIYVSADIFGLVNSAQDDMGIGQVLEDIAESADFICPMVYPSHYAPGSYGIQNPMLHLIRLFMPA